MRFNMSRGLLLAACTLACVTACESSDECVVDDGEGEGEEELCGIVPEITAIKVQCRPVNGEYTLDLIAFSVRDLSGVEDIVDEPIVLVEANRFNLERTDKPWNAEANPDLNCRTNSCEIDYVWEFQSGETEQIFCGDDANSLILQATVDVRDMLGLAARVRESARPL